MARRALRILLFTMGALIVVGTSMVAGAMVFSRNADVLAKGVCPESKPRRLTLFEIAQKRLGQKIYSQWNEETLIRHFFSDERDGFFLDVGAAACCSDSTTHYLASRLGWTGIAIDANASYGPDYVKNRKGTKFFSFFVSDKSNEVADFFLIPGAPAISSGKAAYADNFPFVREHHLEIQQQKVKTITLNQLLNAQHVTKIDFLSMDIEGAEVSALRGFDIDKYKPRLVCIEIQKETTQGILEYFQQHDYQRIEAYLPFDQNNWYFKPSASAKDVAVPQGG